MKYLVILKVIGRRHLLKGINRIVVECQKVSKWIKLRGFFFKVKYKGVP